MKSRWTVLLTFLLPACSGAPAAPATTAIPNVAASFRVIGDSLESDAAVQRLVEPYRAQMLSAVSAVIATAEDRIVKARPDGALGALATDAMLAAARRLSTHPVDAALLNDGGLRAPIPQGPVTLGAIFEVMPFENTITLLQLTGVQLEALADEIAESGGEPISGISFVLHGPEPDARDVLVDGRALEPGRTYWIATADFIANGGGSFQALADPLAREDLTLLIRDAIAEHVKGLGTLRAVRPGRIRVAGP